MPYPLKINITFIHIMKKGGITMIQVISGLALFLYSITQLSNVLKSCVSDNIKHKISKYASSPLLSLLAGTFLTALIQSSSSTTAILISLIRAHIITFYQSIGFIMGANVGTTITAFITGFDLEFLAPVCLIIGILFSTIKKEAKTGLGIFYFGLLFFSISLMETNLVSLLKFPKIQGLILLMSQNSWIAFTFGLIFTTFIQSSSAFIALLQQLCFLNMISLPIAMTLAVGSNIGTTITAYIACIGGSKESKMAAMYHFLFNVFGAICFMIFYSPIVRYIESIFVPVKMQLAYFHALFNIISILAIYPFNKIIIRLIEKLFHYSSFS